MESFRWRRHMQQHAAARKLIRGYATSRRMAALRSCDLSEWSRPKSERFPKTVGEDTCHCTPQHVNSFADKQRHAAWPRFDNATRRSGPDRKWRVFVGVDTCNSTPQHGNSFADMQRHAAWPRFDNATRRSGPDRKASVFRKLLARTRAIARRST